MSESKEEAPVATESKANKPVNVAKQNWKEGLMFGKTRAMPSKDWKSKAGLVEAKPKKEPKPIAKVGARTKERIKENGTEKAFFEKIWEARIHRCEMPDCGQFIPVAKPECFSHNLSKGRYPALRYDPNNITLVCSMECHAKNDARNAGNDIELIQKILGNQE